MANTTLYQKATSIRLNFLHFDGGAETQPGK